MTNSAPHLVDSVAGLVGTITDQRSPAPVTLLVDPAVSDGDVAQELRSMLGAQIDAELQVGGDTALEQVRRTASQIPNGGVVVGVGGGAVIDRSKLAALLASHHRVERTLSLARRCGFVMLPDRVQRSVGLALVPTTVGTGAEASRTACLRTDSTKKIVYGNTLRPDVAALTPKATETLSPWLLAEGALEALIRVASYYVGHHGHRPHADALAEEVVAEIVMHGFTLAHDAPSVTPVTRARLAQLSSRTHRDELHAGLAPYSDTCWPLANELSMTAGIRKLTALALITPALWRRVADGEVVWGSAERLARLWHVIRDAAPIPLEDSAHEGLYTLMDAWSVDTTAPDVDPLAIAERAAHAWGRGLPMLKGLTAEELSPVYADAIRTRDSSFSAA